MQITPVFSVLVSFVVLAVAYPTTGPAKSADEPKELDSNLFGYDYERRADKPEELDSNLFGYDYVRREFCPSSRDSRSLNPCR
ncbi:hypothetical protein BV22DRAFT_1134383 [Leucogyrophana mollusca]|uniref:Uncharacterized protein n=1 Tax=Leucogyrophana mollusca TaxID=85980 RepID=A0ACB8B0H0_9AGAM|nr:hypothetical protein BV22DRAFT_1134383 [Leucogyrophana mollusca]